MAWIVVGIIVMESIPGKMTGMFQVGMVPVGGQIMGIILHIIIRMVQEIIPIQSTIKMPIIIIILQPGMNPILTHML